VAAIRGDGARQPAEHSRPLGGQLAAESDADKVHQILLGRFGRRSMNLPVQTATEVYDEAFRAGLRPDPLLTVSEWADRYRRLSGKAAAEPGPWRTERTPYLREIMDAFSFLAGRARGPHVRAQIWHGVRQ
jgi:hypothetical protein